MVESVAGGGCVDFLASKHTASRITWEARWDIFVPLRVLIGVLLLKRAHRLAKCWAVQALVGIVLGVLFVLSVAWHQGDVNDEDVAELASTIPRGPMTAVTQGYDFMSFALEKVLAWQDRKYGFPQGQALLIGATFAGAMAGIRILKDGPVPEDPIDEVMFTIGRDGRRVDSLPPATVPFFQYLFTAMLWLLGASLLLTATAWPVANVFIFMLVVIWSWMVHCVSLVTQWLRSSQPGQYTELISSSEVEMQMEKATAQALDALRDYIQRNPSAMHKVSQTAFHGLKRMVKDPSMKVSALCYDEGHNYKHHNGGCNVL